MIVPSLIGDLKFEEDVFEEKLNLRIVVAVIYTFLREVLDNAVDDIGKADEGHQVASLFLELLLTLTQLLAN